MRRRSMPQDRGGRAARRLLPLTLAILLLPLQASAARLVVPLADAARPEDLSAGSRTVLPISLPYGQELAAVENDPRAMVLGTGYFHGHAVGLVAWGPGDRPPAALEIVTRPTDLVIAASRPAFAARDADPRAALERLVVNPHAVAAHAPLSALAATPVSGPFAPTEAPSVDGSPVQMLVLTTEALADAFQEYADYRTGLGIPTTVRTVEWVSANWPHGADLAETLRDFVRAAYSLWGVRSLLLGGDTESVPTRYISSTYSLEGESVPTDLYYACLDGNWNADGDERWGEGFTFASNSSDMADLFPELLVGRLPVRKPEEVAALLAKLRAHCEPTVGDYQNKLLFLAEVIWPASYRPGDMILKNGADNVERILNQNDLSTPGWQLERLYETPEWYPGSDPLTRSAALAAMDAGASIVTHIGHGFRYTMSLGDASMTNVNALSLHNATRPFFINMLNCSAAAFDFPCLAEKYLLNPGGGAIGVIGAAREAYPDNIQLFQEAWFNKLVREGFTGAGEALVEARLRYIGQTYDDAAYRWSNFITAYLGDPEIDLWLRAPRTAVVTAAASLAVGTRSTTVTVAAGGAPVAGATVCLWQQGEFYAVARTNVVGQANLAISAEASGTAQLAVAGAGLQPYRGTIAVVSAPGGLPRVVGAPQVTDSGPGTTGNGNGLLEAGETVQLRFLVENRGTGTATGVTVQASCSEPVLSIGAGAVSAGNLAPGSSAWSAPVTVTVAGNALDRTRVRVDLVLRTSLGGPWIEKQELDLLQVSPRLLRVWVDDKTLGNANGVPDANETYDLRVDLKNYGFATLVGGTGQLVTADPDVTILQANATLGSVAHLGGVSSAYRVRETSVTATNRMTLLVRDGLGRTWALPIETRRPVAPAALAGGAGKGAGTVQLTWDASPSSDLAGYVVYRAPTRYGAWNRASADLVRSATSFQDLGLAGGTRYYYAVSAVDSSANESPRTSTLEVTTNPDQHVGWPLALGSWSNSSPVTADLDGDGDVEMVSGAADHLYAWYPDGTELRDGDADPSTDGVFFPVAGNFMPGVAAGDLDSDGDDEIVACTYDTKQVYVLEGNGSVRPGWPRGIVSTTHGIWATPALGDLDGDGRLEIVVLGLDGRLYAWRADGSEWRNGDADPATQGVLYVIPGTANWSRGAPAIADLLPASPGAEIVFGTENARLYLLRSDGSVAPGWPRTTTGKVISAPAVGDLDGDGTLEIAVPAIDALPAHDGKLYVLRPDGTNVPGWPRALPNDWAHALVPSVALADFEHDGELELVAATTAGTTAGTLTVFDRTGAVRSGWPVDVHTASEASPIVGDLDSDGVPEIIYGGESGILYGFRADGSTYPGFPIALGAEVRATPTLCDADQDGRVDLLLPGWDQQVYLWRFSGWYVRENVPWGMFKGNAARNGVVGYRDPTDTEAAAPPHRTRLHAAVPNPFNPRTTIRFEVGGTTAQRTQLRVFDARGRLVRTLVDRDLAPGRYVETWDGLDQDGRRVASGVYFDRLDTPDSRATRKLVLLK